MRLPSTSQAAAGGFRRAERHKSRLRAAVWGPSDSGKTYTCLRLAHALARLMDADDPPRVAVIDSERGRSQLCAGEAPDGYSWDFDVLEMEEHSPQAYMGALAEAERAGYKIVVLDSLSHEWIGVGGALEQVGDAAAQSRGGNSWAAWGIITPVHNRLTYMIQSSGMHVFATLRARTSWDVERDERGKPVPRRTSIKPVQRDGVEYDYDVMIEIDTDHTAHVMKCRYPEIRGLVVNKPGPELMATIYASLIKGTTDEPIKRTAKVEYITDGTLSALTDLLAGESREDVKLLLTRRFRVRTLTELTEAQAAELLAGLSKSRGKAAAPTTEPDAAPSSTFTARGATPAHRSIDRKRHRLEQLGVMPPHRWASVLAALDAASLDDLADDYLDILSAKLDQLLDESTNGASMPHRSAASADASAAEWEGTLDGANKSGHAGDDAACDGGGETNGVPAESQQQQTSTTPEPPRRRRGRPAKATTRAATV